MVEFNNRETLPPFFSLSFSLFFVQGCSKTASERKQKRWPEVMARLDQRAGKFSNLGSTGYGKLCCEKGEGRREGEGSREFTREDMYLYFVYVTFPVLVEIRNFAIPDVEGLTSLL